MAVGPAVDAADLWLFTVLVDDVLGPRDFGLFPAVAETPSPSAACSATTHPSRPTAPAGAAPAVAHRGRPLFQGNGE
ncbi:hypothetical protein ACL02T_09175 [Pseudonocardia sp. RS010]|uniref:hypothetical protein n=1 Tax=Pseudonocardia sp. RS010 TaxID=3385979 RepID=UPI0039A0C436